MSRQRIHNNSLVAWKRNSFYGRLSKLRNELKSLLDFPLTPTEKARVMLSLDFIEDNIKDKDVNIKEFGEINNFKKYKEMKK
jgi:hypothetical protein